MNAKTLSSYRLPSVLGLAHGVSDGAAGLLLGSLATDAPATQITLLVPFYNALGSGAQPLIGYFAGGIRNTLYCNLPLPLYPLYSTRRRCSCARRPPRVGTNLAKPDTLQEWF